MKEFRSANLSFTNYFAPGSERGKQLVEYDNHKGERRELQVDYASINIEETALPAKNNTYDHIVFCEVLEHLTNDPLIALIEINRVLEDGGILVLSTPNVARLENAAALLSGSNIYDPYSSYGPYGRHNREYTSQELNWLLQYTGFQVETFFTLDASPNNAATFYDLELLKPLVEYREKDLGHYMFVRAVKMRDVSSTLKRPMWLYRSLSKHYQLVDLSLLDDPLSGTVET
jgi:SAM-dependent methyltransferase